MSLDRRKRWVLGAGLAGLVLFLAFGMLAHTWSMEHGQTYIGRKPAPGDCLDCHVWTQGGTILDRVLRPEYHTPRGMAVCAGGGPLLVTTRDSGRLLVIDPDPGIVEASVHLGGKPHSVAIDPGCTRAFVTCEDSDEVGVVDLASRTVVSRFPVGYAPAGIALDPVRGLLIVANRLGSTVSILDAATGNEVARLPTGRDPAWVALSPDGREALVASERTSPRRYPLHPELEVTRIDMESRTVSGVFRIENGTMPGGIAIAPQGDIALVPIIRPNSLLTAMQDERGWMMSFGFAVLDMASGQAFPLPLQDPDHPHPDPHGVAITPDGTRAFVSHSGGDIVSVLDLDAIRALILDNDPGELDVLGHRLGTSQKYVLKRLGTGLVPGEIVVSPDGRYLYVAEQMDDTIGVIDVERLQAMDSLALGSSSHVTLVREGEMRFRGGVETSCWSCHPRGGTNGLVYDFFPDGIGRNLNDNRSLHGVGGTAPFKWNGRNPSLFTHCGERFERFVSFENSFTPSELRALVAYMNQLEPAPRRRQAGELEPDELRGQAIFMRTHRKDGVQIPTERRCINCHTPPLYSARRTEDVGTASLLDNGTRFDIPHLFDVGYTAPYLHDGRALTLQEIWGRFDPLNRHGETGDLTPGDLDDLAAFLGTL